MSTLEQAAKQLLEHWDTPLWKQTEMTGTYINALRKAVDEQAEQEPVAWVDLEQWQSGEYDCFTSEKVADYMTPLYTAPVRTKDLTDREIEILMYDFDKDDDLGFARAVIAKDRDKNK